jgi:MFS family permease
VATPRPRGILKRRSAGSAGHGPPPAQGASGAAPSPRSLRGLDWLNFSIANVQTGFGPFIAVYLTSAAWTQVDIGLVLTVSSVVALLAQVPGGVLVDATPSKRSVAAFAAAAIAASALALAAWPIFPLVLLAEILHGLASCLLGPAIAAISLGLVDYAVIGERLGRNASFASIGNGIAAALMGLCGRLFSNRAVFFFTAALAIPALFALSRIRPAEIDPVRARGGVPDQHAPGIAAQLNQVADNRPLLIFSGCLMLFHLANAAMLPLMGSILTMRSSEWATVLIAACIVVPQLVVAAVSPWVGRRAEKWGRRPLLLLGFAALPIRGILFAVIANPYLLVCVQVLDGLSAAMLGVMLPLVVADVTRGTGHFNAALGVVGTTSGVGASISATLAGYMIDRYGSSAAFLCLAGIAILGMLVIWRLMPETRPAAETDGGKSAGQAAKRGRKP